MTSTWTTKSGKNVELTSEKVGTTYMVKMSLTIDGANMGTAKISTINGQKALEFGGMKKSYISLPAEVENSIEVLRNTDNRTDAEKTATAKSIADDLAYDASYNRTINALTR